MLFIQSVIAFLILRKKSNNDPYIISKTNAHAKHKIPNTCFFIINHSRFAFFPNSITKTHIRMLMNEF